MEKHQLGPNGGLIYCMETLLQKIEWLEEEIQHHLDLNDGEGYLIIDCPGQVKDHHLLSNGSSNFSKLRLNSIRIILQFWISLIDYQKILIFVFAP